MKKSLLYISLLILFVNANIYCKPVEKINVNNIKNFFSQNPSAELDSTKLTMIFWISEGSCMSCGVIQGVNAYARLANNLNLDANIITILESEIPEEDIIYKKKFNTLFALDTIHYFKNHNIVSNDNRNNLIIIDQQGKILIQKANFERQAVINLTDYLPVQRNPILPIKLEQSIKLIENDSIIISNNTHPYFLKDKQALMFCDLTLNRILKYSTTTGELIKTISPPVEYKFHFATNFDDSITKSKWLYLDSTRDLVNFKNFLINGNDTLAVAELLKVYYDGVWNIAPELYGFNFSNDKYALIENSIFYSVADSIWLTEYKPYSHNVFLCKKVNALAKDSINGFYLHSQYEFIKLNTKDWTMTKFFKYKSFNPDYEGDDNYIPNIIKYATNGNSEFVAFDYLTKQAKVFHNDSMIAEIPTNEILKKYRKNDKDLIILNDLFLTEDKAALAFSKKENESATSIILLIYDKTGRLISEGTYNNNDRLMDLYCLDLDDNGLVLLDKWRYKRWSIDFFSIK